MIPSSLVSHRRPLDGHPDLRRARRRRGAAARAPEGWNSGIRLSFGGRPGRLVPPAQRADRRGPVTFAALVRRLLSCGQGMPRRSWRMRCPAFVLPLLAAAPPAAPAQELAPDHRRWLEEEVTYIITEREADIFLSLGAADDRDRFIEAFWRKRDPGPGNSRQRVSGRALPPPGVRQPRAPRHGVLARVEDGSGPDAHHPGAPPQHRDIRQLQQSLYQPALVLPRRPEGQPAGLLPPALLQEAGRGSVPPLHSGCRCPGRPAPGPGALLSREQHGAIGPDFAGAGAGGARRGRVGSGRYPRGSCRARIRGHHGAHRGVAETEAIRTDYLDAWERYGRRVSSEYSFNFVPSQDSFAVLVGPDRIPYLHFSVELDLEDLAMDRNRDGSAFVHDARRQPGSAGPGGPPGPRGRQGSLRPTGEGAARRDRGLEVRLPGRCSAGAGRLRG